MLSTKSCLLILFYTSIFYQNVVGKPTLQITEDSAEESENEILTEKSAHEFISNIGIALEKNNMWIAKLKDKNISQMSFVDSITLKYEIRDIVEFIRKVKNDIREYNYTDFDDQNLKRQFKILADADYNILPLNETFIVRDLLEISRHVEFCSFENKEICNLTGKDIFRIFQATNNPEELKYYWNQWMDAKGIGEQKNYEAFLKLFDKAAKLNGFENSNNMLNNHYEEKTIEDKLNAMMNEIHPLYKQLHAYLRHNLRHQYNEDNSLIPITTSPIPDFILQKSVLDSYKDEPTELILPHPDKNLINNGAALKEQGYTAIKMIEKAKEFYRSLGFDTNKMRLDVLVSKMPQTPFFDDSFERRELKLKLGNDITEMRFLQIHIQLFNFLEYSYGYKQPYAFRKLTPKAFRMAIANSIALSVQSSNYMNKIGLLSSSKIDNDNLVNKLYQFAIRVVVPLQKHHTVSQTMKCLQTKTSNQQNCKHWERKSRDQGVLSSGRTSDFDVLSEKSNSWDMDDFDDIFSLILGFQIYEGLCEKSGYFTDSSKTLADCDFSGNTSAGEILKNILTDGGSKPWQEHIEKLLPTGQKGLSADSMLKYYQPLQSWLESHNAKNEIAVGW